MTETIHNLDKEYYNCDSIRNNIHFAFDKLFTCCSNFVRHWEWPMLAENYYGGPLPVEQILTAKRKVVEDNNNPAVQNSCKRCPHLEKKKWDAEESQYFFKDIVLNHFSMCNLCCIYCYTTTEESFINEQRYEYEAYPILKEMIDKGYIGSGCTVYWGGGEPSILPELEKCSQLLIENNIHQVIYSNAVVFSESIESALKKNMMVLTTSLDAGSREMYHKIRGRDYFERAWKNLERYVSAGTVYIKYIVMKENSDPAEIEAFIAHCKVSGIQHVRLDLDEQLLSSGNVPENVLKAAAYLIYKARQAGYRIGGESDLVSVFGDYTPRVGEYLAELDSNEASPQIT